MHAFNVGRDDGGMPGKTCDVVCSIEVAEHVPAPLTDAFVRSIVRSSETVLFSAAVPGQTGHAVGHVNEVLQPHWIATFEGSGMRHEREMAMRLRVRFIGTKAHDFLANTIVAFRKAYVAGFSVAYAAAVFAMKRSSVKWSWPRTNAAARIASSRGRSLARVMS